MCHGWHFRTRSWAGRTVPRMALSTGTDPDRLMGLTGREYIPPELFRSLRLVAVAVLFMILLIRCALSSHSSILLLTMIMEYREVRQQI